MASSSWQIGDGVTLEERAMHPESKHWLGALPARFPDSWAELGPSGLRT